MALTTIRATTAMTAKTMRAGMTIGLRSGLLYSTCF
jgi:hypothetical protein